MARITRRQFLIGAGIAAAGALAAALGAQIGADVRYGMNTATTHLTSGGRRILVPGGEATPDESLQAELAADGGWCWFADPRALYHDGVTYWGYVDKAGSICVRGYAHATQTASAAVTLHAAFNKDDHANPALLLRASDHRLLAFYSARNGGGVYLRVSTGPEDITAWDAEVNLGAQLGKSSYSYPNIMQLTGEANAPLYLFFRARGSVGQPVQYSVSTDGGVTWSAATEVFTENAGSKRPYVKIVPNGDSRIDFAVTPEHPAYGTKYGVYHMYYQGGAYYHTDGTPLGSGPPYTKTDLTQVYDGTSTGSWVWDIAADGSGHPVIVFAAFPATSDHRYQYARWTGAAWDVHEVCAAGGGLYADEPYYSGGVYLDHSDPRIVYASRQVSGQWEMYRYETTDGGATWSEEALTTGSAQQNIRPVTVRDRAAGLHALWLYGQYTSYTSWDMATVGYAP